MSCFPKLGKQPSGNALGKRPETHPTLRLETHRETPGNTLPGIVGNSPPHRGGVSQPPLLAYPCGSQVRVLCPYCGRWHYHGAAVLGHRVAHCGAGAGYMLVLADDRPATGAGDLPRHRRLSGAAMQGGAA